MTRRRIEAFSDGMLAIIIKMMVLELHAPRSAEWAALRPALPAFLSYVLSFVYIGIYWNNHYHMLHVTRSVTGGTLAILATLLHAWIAGALYAAVALSWLIPDRRIERVLTSTEGRRH